MKSRNVIVSLILALFVIAVGGAWWLFMSMDSLVKQAIERWGTEITGVAVRVEGVKIEAAAGRGTIRGLVVGNPKGFEAPHALKLGEMRVTIDPASITKDVIVIRELLLVAPDMDYERRQGGDNLTRIQRNVDAWLAKRAGTKQPDAGPGKKFLIENVIIRSGKAHFAGTLSLPMPDLQTRDIGGKSNGATAGEAVKQVWRAMLSSVLNLALRAGTAIGEGWRKPVK